MKEIPILFSGEMVRAILEGRKTQTRRVMKPVAAIVNGDFDADSHIIYGSIFRHNGELHIINHKNGRIHYPETYKKVTVPYPENPEKFLGWGVTNWHEDGFVLSPYGKPGSRLWVRETWAVQHKFDGHKPRHIPSNEARVHYAATEDMGGLLRRPSIFMPRWASRLTLEITDIRCERLRDIGEEDSIKEGERNRADFQLLWEEINGTCSWAENPWVWVISFKVLKEKK
jgi:hypothetical protein